MYLRIYRLNSKSRTRLNARQAERNRYIRLYMSPESRTRALEWDSQRHNYPLLLEFNYAVKNGSIDICSDGLWFPHQIKTLDKNQFLRSHPNLSEIFFSLSVRYISIATKFSAKQFSLSLLKEVFNRKLLLSLFSVTKAEFVESNAYFFSSDLSTTF